MDRRRIHPTGTGWAQAHEVTGATRTLFISGQVPTAADGTVPADFRSQCRQAWANVGTQLEAAGMTVNDLVKITIFLSDRQYRQEAYEVRTEVLGKEIEPAMTIIITGIYDEAWLLEIEAIAMA